jgi:hypothetical protein
MKIAMKHTHPKPPVGGFEITLETDILHDVGTGSRRALLFLVRHGNQPAIGIYTRDSDGVTRQASFSEFSVQEAEQVCEVLHLAQQIATRQLTL